MNIKPLQIPNLEIGKEVCKQVRKYHLTSSTRAQFLRNVMSYSDQRWLNLDALSSKLWRNGVQDTRIKSGKIELEYKNNFAIFYDKLKELFKIQPFGNCAEQADLAYLELLKRGFRAYRMEFHGVFKKNGSYFEHTFVVFNTQKPLKEDSLQKIKIEKLPKESIIVDPWGDFVSPCSKQGWQEFFDKFKLRRKYQWDFSMSRLPDVQTDVDKWVGKSLRFN